MIRLGRRQCLVQELPAIEGLARVDVVCADKTGTLTENGMRLAERPRAGDSDEAAAERASAALAAADPRPNASLAGDPEPTRRRGGATDRGRAVLLGPQVERASFRGHGNWLLGAPDVLLAAGSTETAASAEQIGSTGLRVLLLGRCDRPVDGPDAPGAVTPQALVVLEQRVRPDARDTLRYFAEQGVEVKVISGDNAVSVGAVAGSLGLPGADRPGRRPRAARRPRRPRRRARGGHGVRPGHPRSRSGTWSARCSPAGTPSR